MTIVWYPSEDERNNILSVSVPAGIDEGDLLLIERQWYKYIEGSWVYQCEAGDERDDS